MINVMLIKLFHVILIGNYESLFLFGETQFKTDLFYQTDFTLCYHLGYFWVSLCICRNFLARLDRWNY